MSFVVALTIGLLFAVGFHQIQDRNLLRIVLGVLVLSQAVNMLIFTASPLLIGRAPFADATPENAVAEPLAQALILTAIVIGFALSAFIVVLARRSYQTFDTSDVDRMRRAEE